MHLLLLQFGMCAICGRGIDEVYCFMIDHCHRTGAIRGLLCNDCNTRLGIYEHKDANVGRKYIEDEHWHDPERLAQIRAYLTAHH